jgi:hypothetical protein
MIRRRTALGLFAGAAAGAIALPSPAVAAGGGTKAAGFDPTNQAQLALAFRKLAYSADDKLTFWWMKGTRYGVTGSVATPFWDMYVAAWFTARDLPDGKYEVKMASANLYTAPGGTTLLEKFANPYTGETLDVPYGKPRVSTTVFDSTGGSAFGSMQMPGMKVVSRSNAVGPVRVEGDTLYVQGDLMLHAESVDASRPSFTVNDMSTYSGSLADVLNPKKRNPPAAQMFNDILDFPSWLKMGDHKGTFFSRCYGRKVYDYASMPTVWRGMFELKYPDIAKTPGAVLKD